MILKFSTKWLLLPGVILFVVGGLTWNALQGVDVSYPFETWRMDLDDALSNLWLGLAAIAALLTAWTGLIVAKRADHRSKRNEHTINGGMSTAAKRHMNEALDHAEIEPGLWKRVDALEKDRDLWKENAEDCLERERERDRTSAAFMKDIYDRLDEMGLGRKGVRQ